MWLSPRRFALALSGLRRCPRPTPAGRVYLAATAAIGTAAAAGAGPGLTMVTGLLLAGATAGLLGAWWNLRGATATRRLPPRAYAGEPVAVEIEVRPTGQAVAVAVADGVDGAYARPGHGFCAVASSDSPGRALAEVRFRERGRRTVSACRLSSRHPLGLFERAIVARGESEVLVLPRLGHFRTDPLPGSRFARTMTCAETAKERGREEFAGLREYRPGDNPRLIAWRATARQRRLMVKEMEDDLGKRVTICLETYLPAGASRAARQRVEKAVSFAATLAVVLSRRNHRVTLLAGGAERIRAATGKSGRGIEAVLERLATVTAGPAGGIDAVVAGEAPEAFATTLPVLIVPEASERLRAALQRIPGRRPPVVYRVNGPWERAAFTYHERTGAES